jgi:hypothetical protein
MSTQRKQEAKRTKSGKWTPCLVKALIAQLRHNASEFHSTQSVMHSLLNAWTITLQLPQHTVLCAQGCSSGKQSVLNECINGSAYIFNGSVWKG